MWVYYLLLLASAILYSVMFFITNRYQKYQSSSMRNGLMLILLGYLVIALFFFIKGCIANKGFHFGFSWFTFLLTLAVACSGTICIILSIKVLKYGEMSFYSIFMMAGSIFWPSLAGMLFYSESSSWLKIVLLALMIFTCFFSADSLKNRKKSKKGILFLFGVFFFNGFKGILFAVYKYNPLKTPLYLLENGVASVDNDIYVTWLGISTVLVSFLVWLFLYFKAENPEPLIKRKSLKPILISLVFLPIGYGLCEGLGDFFSAFSTGANKLEVSVAFPIVSGLTILVSSLIGLIFLKEKITLRKGISIALMLISTIGFIFA